MVTVRELSERNFVIISLIGSGRLISMIVNLHVSDDESYLQFIDGCIIICDNFASFLCGRRKLSAHCYWHSVGQSVSQCVGSWKSRYSLVHSTQSVRLANHYHYCSVASVRSTFHIKKYLLTSVRCRLWVSVAFHFVSALLSRYRECVCVRFHFCVLFWDFAYDFRCNNNLLDSGHMLCCCG